MYLIYILIYFTINANGFVSNNLKHSIIASTHNTIRFYAKKNKEPTGNTDDTFSTLGRDNPSPPTGSTNGIENGDYGNRQEVKSQGDFDKDDTYGGQWEVSSYPVDGDRTMVEEGEKRFLPESIEHADEIREFVKSRTDSFRALTITPSDTMCRLLMGLILYKEKFKDYDVDYDFVFDDETDHKYIFGFPLGRVLNYLLDLIDLHTKSKSLFTKYNEKLTSKGLNFQLDDVLNGDKLLKSVKFPINAYIDIRKAKEKELVTADRLLSRIRKFEYMGGIKKVEDPEESEDEDEEAYPEAYARSKEASDIIYKFLLDEKERLLNSMIFKNPQQLPEPTNKVNVREDVLKKIVSEILNRNKFSNTCPLIQRDTRLELEGGYHYAFYHWSFEDVVQALILFNVSSVRNEDMYYDYNYDLFRSSGGDFQPITFNILKSSFRVPESDYWPEKLWGMPLGLFIRQFRDGDIDAKEHWLRRPILDHIGFNWGDGLRYLKFTWSKLFNGLIWFINYRKVPIITLPPDLVISKNTTVAKFGKPEEIQGLRLGRLVYKAFDQLQVLKRYYFQRYRFIHDLELIKMWRDQIVLGYRPTPHGVFNRVDEDLLVSNDGRYLFDSSRPPPEGVITKPVLNEEEGEIAENKK